MQSFEEIKTLIGLPPTIRCVALVGYFLQAWSVLEANMNEAITEALDLNSLQGAIVTKNIQFRDKIHILKALVELQGLEVTDHKKTLETISTLSHDRNTVAHEMFLADDHGDGVRFIVTKARGKLTFPDVKWSIADFYAKYKEISKLAQEMLEMKNELKRITLASLLRKGFASTSIPPGLGLLNPLSPPPQEPLHSNQTPASPETNTENPPEPDQK